MFFQDLTSLMITCHTYLATFGPHGLQCFLSHGGSDVLFYSIAAIPKGWWTLMFHDVTLPSHFIVQGYAYPFLGVFAMWPPGIDGT